MSKQLNIHLVLDKHNKWNNQTNPADLPQGLFGLYDTKDNCWLGDDNGPTTYTDYMIARVSAQVQDVRLGQKCGRTVAKEYDPAPKRLKDTVDAKMTNLEALTAIEEGIVL